MISIVEVLVQFIPTYLTFIAIINEMGFFIYMPHISLLTYNINTDFVHWSEGFPIYYFTVSIMLFDEQKVLVL